MHKISDYLNIIGDFTYNTESGTIPVLGALERKEQDTNCFFFELVFLFLKNKVLMQFLLIYMA